MTWKHWSENENPTDAVRVSASLIARKTTYNGDVIIGKIVLGSVQLCYFHYPGTNEVVSSCEYLVKPVGVAGTLTWEDVIDGEVPCGAIPTGHSADGTDTIYIGQSLTSLGSIRTGSYSSRDGCNYMRVSRYNTTSTTCSTTVKILTYIEGEKP